ncbi:hypothetical protein DPMN_046149 [Dreissena polymorpha]|uniref:Uncharacterized protein n=1 Tax=Dreissena polymorpha TaxID=45954 RepID=A0A9D4D7D5_DREPO|nr:hypothetical protein DPMN_046149 [Dreissena polymorpha]
MLTTITTESHNLADIHDDDVDDDEIHSTYPLSLNTSKLTDSKVVHSKCAAGSTPTTVTEEKGTDSVMVHTIQNIEVNDPSIPRSAPSGIITGKDSPKTGNTHVHKTHDLNDDNTDGQKQGL